MDYGPNNILFSDYISTQKNLQTAVRRSVMRSQMLGLADEMKEKRLKFVTGPTKIDHVSTIYIELYFC